ncbi:MAG: tryptophan-rich sensory protein [Clostridiales bacterium]|nr:tryptophan-rich sensory protein [Clostridiales bacterium]
MATTAHLKKRASVPLFLTTTLGTVLLGMLAGLFSGSKAGYSSLVLPPATPPDKVFPIVWSVLYAMIGMSLFFTLRKPAVTTTIERDRKTATVLWWIQLGFNLLWPFAFFTLHLYTFSLLWLIALSAINLAAIIYAFRVSPTAGALLVPYEGWLLFDNYLNLFIAILN